MVLRWYLKESWKCLLIPINGRSNLLCDMLVNEQYCNVLAFCELLESCLDCGYLCLGIHYQEILLLLFVNVSYPSKEETCDRIFISDDCNEVSVFEGRVRCHALFKLGDRWYEVHKAGITSDVSISSLHRRPP